MVVTKALLKKEIDNVQEEYLLPLYKIIKTFENSDDFDEFKLEREKKERKKDDWIKFIDKYAGCLPDTPIKRGDQGNFEVRERIIQNASGRFQIKRSTGTLNI